MRSPPPTKKQAAIVQPVCGYHFACVFESEVLPRRRRTSPSGDSVERAAMSTTGWRGTSSTGRPRRMLSRAGLVDDADVKFAIQYAVRRQLVADGPDDAPHYLLSRKDDDAHFLPPLKQYARLFVCDFHSPPTEQQ